MEAYKITFKDGSWLIMDTEVYNHVITIQLPLAKRLNLPVLLWVRKQPVIVSPALISEEEYISKQEALLLLNQIPDS